MRLRQCIPVLLAFALLVPSAARAASDVHDLNAALRQLEQGYEDGLAAQARADARAKHDPAFGLDFTPAKPRAERAPAPEPEDAPPQPRQTWSVLGEPPTIDELRMIDQNITRLIALEGGVDRFFRRVLREEARWFEENALIAELTPDPRSWDYLGYGRHYTTTWPGFTDGDEEIVWLPGGATQWTSAPWPWVIHITPPTVRLYTPKGFLWEDLLPEGWQPRHGLLDPVTGWPTGGFVQRTASMPSGTSFFWNLGGSPWGLNLFGGWGDLHFGHRGGGDAGRGWNVNVQYHAHHALPSSPRALVFLPGLGWCTENCYDAILHWPFTQVAYAPSWNNHSRYTYTPTYVDESGRRYWIPGEPIPPFSQLTEIPQNQDEWGRTLLKKKHILRGKKKRGSKYLVRVSKYESPPEDMDVDPPDGVTQVIAYPTYPGYIYRRAPVLLQRVENPRYPATRGATYYQPESVSRYPSYRSYRSRFIKYPLEP